MAFSLILATIEAATSLRRTTDIYEAFLPKDDTEGVQLRITSESFGEGEMEEDSVSISVFYKNYQTAKTNAKAIFDALKNHRGIVSSGNYSVVGTIFKDYVGQDAQLRHIFDIRLIVRH